MQKLQIWWIPQVPMDPFYWPVTSVLEGKKMLDLLTAYDTFQFENKVKPDYSNMGGLNVFNEELGDWEDWANEEGDGIDEVDIKDLM